MGEIQLRDSKSLITWTITWSGYIKTGDIDCFIKLNIFRKYLF